MSATTAGAIKTLLEGASLGVMIFRDEAPQGEELPYIVVSEGISMVPEPAVNQRNDNTVREMVQVDVWQRKRDRNGTVTESYTLPDKVAAALTGAGLPTAPKKAYGMTLENSVRTLDPDPGILHHAITALVRRQLS